MSFRAVLRAAAVALLLISAGTAAAGSYPPPSGGASGEVDVSRVHAGGDVVFSGHGFRAHVELTIRDSADGTSSTFALGAPGALVVRTGTVGMAVSARSFRLTAVSGDVIGTTRTNAAGEFSTVVHFGADAERGRHVLSATGIGADGRPLTVSVVVFVTGVSQRPGESNHPIDHLGGGMPFTGFAGAGLALGGILLVGLGSGLLLLTERRHRARRALRRRPA